jgi:DnaJ-class molecular chaperone
MPVLQSHRRGDQRILVNVLVPRHLNDEQRRLLREFDERADDRTYGKSEGLFGKFERVPRGYVSSAASPSSRSCSSDSRMASGARRRVRRLPDELRSPILRLSSRSTTSRKVG